MYGFEVDIMGIKEEKGPAYFNHKLVLIMDLIQMSNVSLGKAINVDPSLISRYKSGSRTPASNSELKDNISYELYEALKKQEKIDELSEIIGLTVGDYEQFKEWLMCFKTSENTAIKSLLANVKKISATSPTDIPNLDKNLLDKFSSDTQKKYTGKDGLREASLRFFAETIIKKPEKICLYSDEKMDWMLEDTEYRMLWLSSMASVLKAGTHIDIIHNIERDVTEMVDAINSWLPFYLTGLIKSYYSKASNGERFVHTLFLCPDSYGVFGVNTGEDSSQYIYEFATDAEKTEYINYIYKGLLDNSKELVVIDVHKSKDSTRKSDSTEKIEFEKVKNQSEPGNITIKINKKSAKIRYNTEDDNKEESVIDFTFYHPVMRKALQYYIENGETD